MPDLDAERVKSEQERELVRQIELEKRIHIFKIRALRRSRIAGDNGKRKGTKMSQVERDLENGLITGDVQVK